MVLVETLEPAELAVELGLPVVPVAEVTAEPAVPLLAAGVSPVLTPVVGVAVAVLDGCAPDPAATAAPSCFLAETRVHPPVADRPKSTRKEVDFPCRA
jgi:hypothetical protein